MSARDALPTHYRRPTDVILDHLVTSGTSGTSDDRDTEGSRGAADTHDLLDTRGTRGTRDTRPAQEPRDHVKLRRSLADQMRDAVWFLSEHGRPRVQLGELLDEAVASWLAEAKANHNGGEDFPHRGRLR